MKGIKNYSYLSLRELESMKKNIESKIWGRVFTSKDKIMAQFRDSNLKRVFEIDREIKKRNKEDKG